MDRSQLFVDGLRRRERLGYQTATISFGSLGTLARLAQYLPEFQLRYLPRIVFIGAAGLLSAPLRGYERIRQGARVRRVAIDKPPIFILGHWRSGTTHLHNLMSQDPTLGYVSMYQAMAMGCSLMGERWLKPLLARVVPLKRPQDNMTWPLDAPQEEEAALGRITPYSFYVQFLFPRRARELFDRYVLLRGVSARAATEWKRKYLQILQVATLHAGGRRLLLKNPVNTARVRLLLELFPDAKFIHIHRSPYRVFPSTKNMHRQLFAVTALQDVDEEHLEQTVLHLYREMMQRFLAEKHLIPAENLVEVRFDDLERDPLGTLRRIYTSLGLEGHDVAEPAFRAYVSSQQAYRKNDFRLSAEDRAKVERHWGFAFDALGYERPTSQDLLRSA